MTDARTETQTAATPAVEGRFNNDVDNTTNKIIKRGTSAQTLFAFDEPQTVTLKNGTVHCFALPSRQTEKTKENLMQTVIITSPAKVNGQNPRQITTDYTKAMLRYYTDTVDTVQGYALNEGDDPRKELPAGLVVEEGKDERGRDRTITVADLVPNKDKKAAAERLYGGKVTVDKPELKDGEKAVKVLRQKTLITIKQEFGIEQNEDGSFTEPTETVFYRFREPQSAQLSVWETKAFNGTSIATNEGGSRETRTYDLDAVEKLFDALIDGIEGGGVERDASGTLQPVDVRNAAHLAKIPLSIKKTCVALLMSDATTETGN